MHQRQIKNQDFNLDHTILLAGKGEEHLSLHAIVQRVQSLNTHWTAVDLASLFLMFMLRMPQISHEELYLFNSELCDLAKIDT